MEIQHPILGTFKIVRQIGTGTFATVYCGVHAELGFKVAIKVFHNDIHFNKGVVERAFEIARKIHHPLICEEFDLFEWEGQLCSLIEFVEGLTLLEYANDYGPLNEYEIQTILGQIVIAVDFLHAQNIIHRDLKCENIMIDTFHNVRLIDFGFACVMADEGDLHSTTCGSPAYVAPEIVHHEEYSFSVDVWSIGIILYAIAVGCLPFEDPSLAKLLSMIANDKPEIPDFLSEKLADLISQMLCKDPESRISLQALMHHPFFSVDDYGRAYTFDASIFTQFEENGLNAAILNAMKLNPQTSEKLVAELEAKEVNANTMLYQILRKSFLSNKISGFSRIFLKPCQVKVPHRVQTYNNSKSYNGKSVLLPAYQDNGFPNNLQSSFESRVPVLTTLTKVVIKQPTNIKVRTNTRNKVCFRQTSHKPSPHSYSPMNNLSKFLGSDL